MKRSVRVAISTATAAATLAVMATVANAASAPIAGTTNSSTWVTYATSRTTTRAAVDFQPTDLLFQAGPVSALNLRLTDSAGSVISSGVNWNNSYAQKSLISGIAIGYKFRISACCYSSSGGDTGWAGTLTY